MKILIDLKSLFPTILYKRMQIPFKMKTFIYDVAEYQVLRLNWFIIFFLFLFFYFVADFFVFMKAYLKDVIMHIFFVFTRAFFILLHAKGVEYMLRMTLLTCEWGDRCNEQCIKNFNCILILKLNCRGFLGLEFPSKCYPARWKSLFNFLNFYGSGWPV